MEIKECKSSNSIIREIKQKLLEIGEKIKENYSVKLCTYICCRDTNILAQFNERKILIFDTSFYVDMVKVSFYEINGERKLEITIIDPSEFLYSIVKEEFTKFAEMNKNSIRSVCFIKDF